MKPAHSRPASQPLTRQRGAALVVAIIMLLVMAVFAFSAVRFSNLERKMGSNEEYRIAAFQGAQSVAEATIANPNNTPVFGGVNYTLCTSTAPPGVSCNQNTLTLPDGYLASLVTAGKVTAQVTRSAPEFQNAPRSANLGSSLTNFTAASFSITGNYDRSSDGYGQEQISQGLILVFPKN